MFGGVRGVDVHGDEPHVWILELGLGRSREIRQPCTQAKHDVGRECDPVRRQRAGDTNAAETERVRLEQGALAGLGRDRKRHRVPGLQGVSHYHSGERKHRSDRQVTAAGNDDEGQADGDDRIDHGLLNDIQQVARRQEVRCQHAQPDAKHDESADGARLARVGGYQAG